MRGKQTGRPDRVKQNDTRNPPRFARFLSCALGAMALTIITACAPSVGGWRSPVKNEASTRADYALCQNRAETTTLQLRQEERPGFGPAERPGTFNPRGDDTMAIADRNDATNLYDVLLSSCMTRKGYRQPGDARPPGE